MGQLENELSDTQTKLETATKNLEEKEKALQNVSFVFDGISSVCRSFVPMHDDVIRIPNLDHWIHKLLIVWSFWVPRMIFNFFREKNGF